MEKGGWLDQIMEGVLAVLTNRWLGYAVAFAGGAIVTSLSRRSPKQDWEYIKEGPGRVLLGAFFVSASLRSVPRAVFPELRFVCDETTGPFGIPQKSNCRTESEGELRSVVDYTLFDMMKDMGWGMLQELVIGGIGAAVGLLVAFGTAGVPERRSPVPDGE